MKIKIQKLHENAVTTTYAHQSERHTSGPWAFIVPDGVSVRHPQVYSDTGPVCNATWLGDGRLKELTANARLIAAAPDLLEALQNLLTWVQEPHPYSDRHAAIAAIVKATGGAS